MRCIIVIDLFVQACLTLRLLNEWMESVMARGDLLLLCANAVDCVVWKVAMPVLCKINICYTMHLSPRRAVYQFFYLNFIAEQLHSDSTRLLSVIFFNAIVTLLESPANPAIVGSCSCHNSWFLLFVSLYTHSCNTVVLFRANAYHCLSRFQSVQSIKMSPFNIQQFFITLLWFTSMSLYG